MIKHIVSWNLKNKGNPGDAISVKNALEDLNGKIPGLLRLEVGIDFSFTGDSANLVLYSELESKEALATYQQHPEHLKAAEVVKASCCDRRVIDYEI